MRWFQDVCAINGRFAAERPVLIRIELVTKERYSTANRRVRENKKSLVSGDEQKVRANSIFESREI